MTQKIRNFSYLVKEYDATIAFFTNKLGFTLLSDVDLGGGKRWVQLQPDGASEFALALTLADTPDQQQAVGKQAGDAVLMILQTDNFQRDYALMLNAGIVFNETPRIEPYGMVAVFEDLYGNLWDLLEPNS
ncbi:VOC family protein [Thalassotalea mangrovi]|uniref:VOC family protein n=1 Tax=Thalassotalea mangrovi TaxID=2572245 RepID=A0A4V5NTW4_9GAMM|nr:VOC family protein [Thalassotalea mangrovi]TKB43248.1 VOC family protein [Thalassotalea mangrovi]